MNPKTNTEANFAFCSMKDLFNFISIISIYNIISHFIHRTTGICTLLKIKSFPVSVEEILWNLAAY